MDYTQPVRRMMKPKFSPTLKIVLIGFLILVMLLPIGMIQDTVGERSRFRDSATESIRQGWAGSQIFSGPILVLPYTVPVEIKSFDRELNKEITRIEQQSRTFYIFPERFDVTANLRTEERYRGIYKIPVYHAALQVEGTFSAERPELPEGGQFGTPYLVILVSDIRGIGPDIQGAWQGVSMTPEPGTMLRNLTDGVHFSLPETATRAVPTSFHLALSLKGTGSLAVVPVGHNASFHASSSWAHPSFSGPFLPSTREISDDGFKADWETTFLATNFARHFTDCAANNDCSALSRIYFGIDLFEPVDIYQQTERAVKYAVLFLSLTFGVFFAFEVLKNFQIHPVQYLLVGGALTIFYLLLLSLSEHMPFGLAYGIAASAVVGLLGFYVAAVLKSRRKGALFAAIVASVYGVLYVILLSEDNALLMGTVFLFAVLAAFMAATRKVDWYNIGPKRDEPTASP